MKKELAKIEQLQMAWLYFEEDYDIEELETIFGYGNWYIKRAINKYHLMFN